MKSRGMQPLFVLPTVPTTLAERQHLRPIGRNNERYQQMLDKLQQLVVLAEEAGFDVFAYSPQAYRWHAVSCPGAMAFQAGSSV